MSVSARKVPPPPFDPIDASPPVLPPPASQPQVPLFRTLIASAPWRDRRRTRSIATTIALLLHALLILIVMQLDVPTNMQQIPFPDEQITLFQIAAEAPAASSPPTLEYHPGPVVPLDVVTVTPTAIVPPAYAPPRRPAAHFPEQTNPNEPERVGPVGSTGGGRGMTPAQKLHPQLIDPRLWAAPEEMLGAPVDEAERMRARLYSRLEEMNDSIAGINETRRKEMDWTIKDKNGGKWGIDPKGIHLGKLTLPAPLVHGPADARDEVAKQAANWRELNTQEDRARLHSTFNDRVKAIREQKQKEHDTKGKGTDAKPSDTTKPAPAPTPTEQKDPNKPVT